MTDGKVSKVKVAQGKAAKVQTIESIIAKKKAVLKKVFIQLDGEVANQIEDLRQLHAAARDTDRTSNDSDKAPAIQKKIDKLVSESQDTVQEFTFKSFGRLNYEDLVGEHPPSDEDKKAGAEYDPDTFPPALVSAACSKLRRSGHLYLNDHRLR